MPKILIVDDEQINLDFFEVMLTKLGFEVEKASDGEKALEAVRDTNPDLIVLDNIMPKLTGWQVTKILKQDEAYAEYSDVPIIMFSAMDDVKDKLEGFELGIEDYITKPFNFSEVLARIKAVLRHHELGQQVIHRERRLALLESLNASLVDFTSSLKIPMEEMLKNAGALDPSNTEAVRAFVKAVQDSATSTQSALDGLAREIAELQEKGAALRESELTLDALEEKYQKQFQNLRENADTVGES